MKFPFKAGAARPFRASMEMRLPNGEPIGQGGEYVAVGGLRVYYEVHGEGEPVLLLHGGMATLESMVFQIAGLSPKYRVICPERRGHGRTRNPGGAITYEGMAEETLAFCRALGLERVRVVGWSDGGIVAALAASAAPDFASRLALIGANCSTAGYTREFLARMREATADGFGSLPARRGTEEGRAAMREATADTFEPLARETWQRASGDPAGWAPFFEEMKRLWLSEWHVDLERLARITVPTLVLQGDRDLVTLEHALEMYRALPAGQLCILPRATHYAPVEQPDLVNAALLRFLGAP